MATSDFDKVVERYHQSLDVFMKGSAEDTLALFSHREDVTLGNPFGPVARGFDRVAETARFASSHMRDGKARGFDTLVKHVMPEYAYIVEVERLETKLDGGKDVTPYSLRVTTIFEREGGQWKVAHRHADPITTAQPWDSVIAK